MTREEIHTTVLAALRQVAPEADPGTIRGNVPIRDQVEIDSFDFLNFVVALHTQLGVDIPERDYAKLGTVDAAVAYLEQTLAPS